jgi:hypothetical protein
LKTGAIPMNHYGFYSETVGTLREANIEIVEKFASSKKPNSSIIDWIDDGCEVL